MVSETHPRLKLALFGSLLAVTTLSCARRQQPQNEVNRYGEDLVASGSAPRMSDSVPGDAILAGGDVRFSGAIGGDYLGAGGSQTINGRIHGSLRTGGGSVYVTAAIDRNATVIGGNVELDSTAVVGRNAYLAGSTIRVSGTVRDGLIASGGTVNVNGLIGGDVQINAGELRIGPHAQIAGNLRYRVPGGKFHIDPAARITGTVTALPAHRGNGFFRVLWMLGFLLAGAVVVALVPRFAADAAETLRQRPGRSAILGVAAMILVPIAICIALVTIIGIPFAVVAVAVFVVLVYLARIPLAVWLGRVLLGASTRTSSQGALVHFLVGGLVLVVVGLIPFLGGLVTLIATILGFGTILLLLQALRERQPV
jgi:cytoskeletal protein CcmA (bactofilin family)